MKRALNLITVTDLLFIFILSLTDIDNSVLAFLFYPLAFIVPAVVAILVHGAEKISWRSLLPNKKSLDALTLTAPFLGTVVLISFLTSLILTSLGHTDTAVDVSGNIFIVILRHALLPALLEELLFRFLPIQLLGEHSRKWALLISAIFFSVIHGNLFQIPYALIAGLILSYVTIAAGSVFPAFIMHFLNNLLSVIIMRAPEASPLPAVIYTSLAVLSALSIAYLVIKRKKYLPELKSISGDKCKPSFTLASVLFLILMVTVSIYNLSAGAI